MDKSKNSIFDCFGECDKCHSDDIKVFGRYSDFDVMDGDNCQCANCGLAGKIIARELFVGECYVNTEYHINWRNDG